MEIVKEFFFKSYFLVPFAIIATYLFSTRFLLYDVILYVSREKGLMDTPGGRRVHKSKVPPLGGLGLFITFSLPMMFFAILLNFEQGEIMELLSLTCATIIVLFLGVKDDLVLILAYKKLVGQIVAVSTMVILTDVRIASFYGVFGIEQLPMFWSIAVTIFFFVVIINAVNLIDGIDGLAGSISIISTLSFGIIFMANDNQMLTLTSAILLASLAGFLKYNLSSHRKIFMGDCGSMLVGTVLAYLGIKFMDFVGTLAPNNMLYEHGPIMLLAIFSYPLFDTLRVFIVRISQKRSPFDADKNHIHHKLLSMGLSHKQSTIFLVVSNIMVILCSFLINGLEINLQLLLLISISTFIYLIPFSKAMSLLVNLSVKKKTTSIEKAVHK